MSANETADAILIVIKRVAKWAMAFVIGVIALGFLVWGATAAYQTYKNRPYPLTEYDGIKLGDTQAEVMYVKGVPTYVLEAEGVAGPDGPPPPKGFRLSTKVADIAKHKSVEDYIDWEYQGTDERIDISFDKTQKAVTEVGCYSHDYLGCEPVFGLYSGCTEQQVRTRLGKPAREELESGVKTMHYPAFNLTIHLEKERVYMFKVARPTTSRNPSRR